MGCMKMIGNRSDRIRRLLLAEQTSKALCHNYVMEALWSHHAAICGSDSTASGCCACSKVHLFDIVMADRTSRTAMLQRCDVVLYDHHHDAISYYLVRRQRPLDVI
jgi:hypothetical protein